MLEFREALVAHAAFRQPSLLFQKHPGKKVSPAGSELCVYWAQVASCMISNRLIIILHD